MATGRWPTKSLSRASTAAIGRLGVLVSRGGPLSQDGLEDAGQEERPEQVAVVEMGEQVGVMAAIGGQHAAGQREHLLGLRHIAESGAALRVQGRASVPTARRTAPATALSRRARSEEGIGVVELLLPARIGPAVGEIQIAQQRRGGDDLFQLCVTFIHR